MNAQETEVLHILNELRAVNDRMALLTKDIQ